jgi:hypothetical protein
VNQSMPTVPVICQGPGYPLPVYDSRNSHRFLFNLSKAIDLAPLPIIRALHSDGPEVVLLASTLLDQRVASA